MPINNEGIKICANCGNPWGSHYGNSCFHPAEPNPQGFQWDPIGSTTEEQIGPLFVSRYPTNIRVEDARRVTVHHGYNAFVALVPALSDDRLRWLCCHFETGVSLSGYSTTPEEAIDRAS